MLKPLPKFPAVALSCAPRCAVRTAKGRQPQTSWALGLAEAHWRAGLCQGCPARPCTASRAAPGRAQLCSLCAWAQPRAALDLPALRGNHSRSCAGGLHFGEAQTYRISRLCFGKGQTLRTYRALWEQFCRLYSHWAGLFPQADPNTYMNSV